MNADFVEFRRGVVAPLECIKEGWALIKDDYWLFMGITIVGFLIGGAIPIVLLGPMMVGIFICLQQRQRHQPVEFGMLFKGFDQFVPGLVATVLKMIPIIIMLIPYYIFLFSMMAFAMPKGEASPEAMRGFMMSFFGLEIIFVVGVTAISIMVEIFFMLAYPLIADKQMSGLEAVKLSFRAGKANFGGILGLLLLNALFGMIGVLCCIIGVYFYLPVSIAAQAVAYRRIFPDVATSYPTPPPPPGDWT